MIRKITSGVAAGILVSIGGAVFLSCDNRYVGAVLFSVALLCICLKGYSLFTGRVGYIPETHDRETVSALLLGLLGNLIGTALCGLALRHAVPAIGAAAETACAARLTQAPLQTFARAVLRDAHVSGREHLSRQEHP
ncbi:MAG: formate/nitrite transporter family protein, partial [Clostridia bacterium]|nr:formate/nitrite transporter family protein [Clostridia bacterium]